MLLCYLGQATKVAGSLCILICKAEIQIASESVSFSSLFPLTPFFGSQFFASITEANKITQEYNLSFQ